LVVFFGGLLGAVGYLSPAVFLVVGMGGVGMLVLVRILTEMRLFIP